MVIEGGIFHDRQVILSLCAKKETFVIQYMRDVIDCHNLPIAHLMMIRLQVFLCRPDANLVVPLVDSVGHVVVPWGRQMRRVDQGRPVMASVAVGLREFVEHASVAAKDFISFCVLFLSN